MGTRIPTNKRKVIGRRTRKFKLTTTVKPETLIWLEKTSDSKGIPISTLLDLIVDYFKKEHKNIQIGIKTIK